MKLWDGWTKEKELSAEFTDIFLVAYCNDSVISVYRFCNSYEEAMSIIHDLKISKEYFARSCFIIEAEHLQCNTN